MATRENMRSAVAPAFTYVRDVVCITALVLYVVNRWLIKPWTLGIVPFFHDYLNDILCIPLFLPPVLWIHKRIGLRPARWYPTAFEILFHLVVWSICFEVIAPSFPAIFRTTADPWDVAAYGVGAGIAGLVWGSWRDRRDESARAAWLKQARCDMGGWVVGHSVR